MFRLRSEMKSRFTKVVSSALVCSLFCLEVAPYMDGIRWAHSNRETLAPSPVTQEVVPEAVDHRQQETEESRRQEAEELRRNQETWKPILLLTDVPSNTSEEELQKLRISRLGIIITLTEHISATPNNLWS